LDESFLALNILHRSPHELLKPLDYHQGAPILFLLLQKGMVIVFGSSELAFRFIPLVCGIASIVLFTKFAKWILPPNAVPIAVALFAIAEPLIYFSSEVKQYSGDVFTALVLCLVARPLVDRASMSLARAAAVALSGAIAIWFSQPAIFTLAALGLIAIWGVFGKNERLKLLPVAFIGAVWASSFLPCYFVSLRGLRQDHFLLDYWRFAFAPLPVSFPRDVKWIVFSIVDVLSYPASHYFKFVMESGIAFAVLGAIDLLFTRPSRFLIVILPMALTLLAATAQAYPFGGRLILFLLPATILLLAAGMGAILRKTSASYLLSGIVLIAFFFFLPAITAGIVLLKGGKGEEIRPVIQ